MKPYRDCCEEKAQILDTREIKDFSVSKPEVLDNPFFVILFCVFALMLTVGAIIFYISIS